MRASLAMGAARSPGVYPVRSDGAQGKFEKVAAPTIGLVTRSIRSRASRFQPIVDLVNTAGSEMGGRSDQELVDEAHMLRRQLRSSHADQQLGIRTFALVRELAERTVGMRHFDVQVIGGWIMLEGMVAEMQTGEGKTLAATLPAATVALAGTPVHVVSVNDYLVARDAETMGPLYRSLGLTVGVIQEGMDADQRRDAYGCDITYVSNKQICFDYLKDRITMGRHRGQLRLQLERLHAGAPRLRQLVLRGLHFAIVDEIDSVLVDEARTPLIISRPVGPEGDAKLYEDALELAANLKEGVDFRVARGQRRVDLTVEGSERLERRATPLGGVWASALYRDELCTQALSAQHLYHRDRHYLVVDDKVQIVDEFTGRLMADRSWQRGLHQMLEAKEGCSLSSEKETLARTSYQRFFRRYLRLAGMTGTAREIAGELWSVYNLAVASVPTRRPRQRRDYGERIFATRDEKYAAVLSRVRDLHEQGRPVLVGTRSVEASEELAEIFAAAGLTHQVLNARQNADEAQIVMGAGERDRITVATNMAGRGTDIVLGEGVADLGGLHVIGTEFHEARRIDRQLFGRCARQGDPGSFEALASLEDELATQHGSVLANILRSPAGASGAGPAWLRRVMMRYWQRTIEARHARTRRQLVKMDEQLGRALAFTGRTE